MLDKLMVESGSCSERDGGGSDGGDGDCDCGLSFPDALLCSVIHLLMANCVKKL